MSKKRTQTNDTSSLVIKTPQDLIANMEAGVLRKTILEHEAKLVAFAQTIDKLMKSLEAKDAEIMHLRELLLGGNLPVVEGSVTRLEISDEEEIAEIQLQKLKAKSNLGELTLEEVKKYDLLVKNKRLAQGNATMIPDYQKLPSNTSKKELIQLAAYKNSEETNE